MPILEAQSEVRIVCERSENGLETRQVLIVKRKEVVNDCQNYNDKAATKAKQSLCRAVENVPYYGKAESREICGIVIFKDTSHLAFLLARNEDSQNALPKRAAKGLASYINGRSSL